MTDNLYIEGSFTGSLKLSYLVSIATNQSDLKLPFDVDLTSLDIALQTSLPGTYSLGAMGSVDVALFDGTSLNLQNIYFQVEVLSSKLNTALLYGTLEIGSIYVDLSATYSQTDGWIFTGGPPASQSISITNLIQDLFEKFDPPITLPSFFPDITLNNLQVELRPSQDKLTLNVDIDQNAALLIQLNKDTSGKWQGLVSLFYQPKLDLISYIPILNQAADEPLELQLFEIIYASAAGISYENPLDQTTKTAAQGLTFHVDLLLGDKVFSLPQTEQPSSLLTKENLRDSSNSSPTLSFPIQKAIGPLQFEKIGLGFAGPDLALFLDVSASVGGLSFDLMGFSLSVPLNDPSPHQWQFNLNGLGLSYLAGPIDMSGSLLKLPDSQSRTTEYDGQALINIEELSISALGSLIVGQGPSSLFVFAFVDDIIGGPPAFLVTGLAMGFGYNRLLQPPSLDQFNSFPLVQAFRDPTTLVGPNDPSSPAAMNYALETLDKVISEQVGEYWLAAGIKFTSFELINSTALAIVEFGKEFEIILLGKSFASLPAQGESYAYVELDLEVVLDPAQGLFQASALLSNNSYVLDPSCHLMGGFAFYVWFGSNVHAGEFVLTLGGYHPAFTPPAYYPSEPRLGFNWIPSGDVTIKGGSYFALTPSCIMAGGSLEVLFQSGDLRAWLTAYADVLAHWNPFYFIADIGITVGCSYRLDLWLTTITFKVELGATLMLWGPPTGGTAHIDWYIISFSIPFGADQREGISKIGWDDFKTMLPQSPNSARNLQNIVTLSLADTSSVEISHIRVTDGLLGQVKNDDQTTRWLVRADEFTLAIESAIPLTQITFNNQVFHSADQQGQPIPDYFVAIRPMQVGVDTTSTQTISVTSKSGSPISWQDSKRLNRDMPTSLWGKPIDDPQNIDPNDRLLPNRLIGLEKVIPQSQIQPGHTGPIDMQTAFTYFPIDEQDEKIPPYLPLSINPSQHANTPQQSNQALTIIHNTLTQVANIRTSIFKDLQNLTNFIGTDGTLDNLTNDPISAFEAEPLLGSLPLS
ncbi:DUF6603 domain-containing protein [Candidatus Odyssella acanthamoebae]|uniref:DUF6603 domain-containing protein n=1 Tax=Candidatus Odyssella acanthamoebae TaxID=91604 RepID=A0A077AVF2_9PROT|nr:DUF6603 domain-containing protein [Candidatus Paracaedibacter acanthamoebae]AIK95628.1 hypothetical protein ID47_00995 [Candidatus Paracaedibacter acanthamoebae]